jgi:hypothetical protein
MMTGHQRGHYWSSLSSRIGSRGTPFPHKAVQHVRVQGPLREPEAQTKVLQQDRDGKSASHAPDPGIVGQGASHCRRVPPALGDSCDQVGHQISDTFAIQPAVHPEEDGLTITNDDG